MILRKIKRFEKLIEVRWNSTSTDPEYLKTKRRYCIEQWLISLNEKVLKMILQGIH